MSKVYKPAQLIAAEPKLIQVERPVLRLAQDPEPEPELILVPETAAEELENAASDRPGLVEAEAEVFALKQQREEALSALEAELAARRQDSEQELRVLREQANRECDTWRETARADVERLKEQALDECTAIQETAREQAYQESLKQAQEDIENDRQLAMEQIRLLLTDADKKYHAMVAQAEPAIVALSMAVAQKIVSAELTQRPELIVDIVKEAIAHLDNPLSIRLQVNPKDDLYLSGGQLTSPQNGNIEVVLMPDEAIARGGCILESNMAVVDSRLETRIANMENTLNEVLQNG